MLHISHANPENGAACLHTFLPATLAVWVDHPQQTAELRAVVWFKAGETRTGKVQGKVQPQPPLLLLAGVLSRLVQNRALDEV